MRPGEFISFKLRNNCACAVKNPEQWDDPSRRVFVSLLSLLTINPETRALVHDVSGLLALRDGFGANEELDFIYRAEFWRQCFSATPLRGMRCALHRGRHIAQSGNRSGIPR